MAQCDKNRLIHPPTFELTGLAVMVIMSVFNCRAVTMRKWNTSPCHSTHAVDQCQQYLRIKANGFIYGCLGFFVVLLFSVTKMFFCQLLCHWVSSVSTKMCKYKQGDSPRLLKVDSDCRFISLNYLFNIVKAGLIKLLMFEKLNGIWHVTLVWHSDHLNIYIFLTQIQIWTSAFQSRKVKDTFSLCVFVFSCAEATGLILVTHNHAIMQKTVSLPAF